MKSIYAAVILIGCLVAGSAFAQTDDVKWVNQCVKDSAGYQVSEQVKVMYCTCMVGKMNDKETRSVTQWEQANPEAAKDCARRAGWN
ncbi:MAG TPA: hypothetical protein VJ890_25835 [Vineibacter sp.]|nr:hypothetical protein [Vineibacter sp.]